MINKLMDDQEAFLAADLSRLTIKNHIASGSYGSVFKGVYDGKEVAVKVLDVADNEDKAAILNAFTQEVSIWNKLDHPNIAKLIGATKTDADLNIKTHHHGSRRRGNNKCCMSTACCMVAEYVHGGTLRSFLWRKRSKRLSIGIAISLALDVAKGISYLHSQKIVHRDVKPENVLLDKETHTAKIIDFGLSKFEDLNQMTADRGTAGYIAPEVLLGSLYDHKCDVFSFGICLWEILYCKKPDLSMSFRPRIPLDCPRDLAGLMQRCWDAEPDRRPEMAEVVQILEAMQTSRLEDDDHEGTKPKGCFSCFLQR